MRIGYYDLEAGVGVDAQGLLALAAGHSGVEMSDLSAASIGGARVVWAQNGDTDGYGSELFTTGADLAAFVEGGGVAVLNDAAVDGAVIETLFSTLASQFLNADVGADAREINFVCDNAFLTFGSGGFLDDESLDGVARASYGYVDIEGVCDAQIGFLMTRADARQGVTVLVRAGDGFAIYSTVGMMDRLTGDSAGNLAMQALAENMLGEAARLAGLEPVDAGATIFSTNHSDLLIGNPGGGSGPLGAGRDMFYGGDNQDFVNGEVGADMIWGGGHNDTLYGKAGRDQLWGGAGDDAVLGGNGEDFLVGGSGDATLRGAAGDDTIFGNSGEDVIYARRGLDIMFGGDDDDRFYFAAGESGVGDSADQIMDFEGSGADVIDLVQFGTLFWQPGGFTGGGNDEFYVEEVDPNTAVIHIDLDADSVSDMDIIVHHDGFFGVGDINWFDPT